MSIENSFDTPFQSPPRELKVAGDELIYLADRLLGQADHLSTRPASSRTRAIQDIPLLSEGRLSLHETSIENSYQATLALKIGSSALRYGYSGLNEHWTVAPAMPGELLVPRSTDSSTLVARIDEQLPRPIFNDMLDTAPEPRQVINRIAGRLAPNAKERSETRSYSANTIIVDNDQLLEKTDVVSLTNSKSSAGRIVTQELTTCTTRRLDDTHFINQETMLTVERRQNGEILTVNATTGLASADLTRPELEHYNMPRDDSRMLHELNRSLAAVVFEHTGRIAR